MTESYGSYIFNIWRKCQSVSHSLLCWPVEYEFQVLSFIVSTYYGEFKNLRNFSWCLATARWHFPGDAACLSTRELTTWISSLVQWLFVSFAHFEMECLISFEFSNFLYSAYNLFIRYMLWKCFFSCV